MSGISDREARIESGPLVRILYQLVSPEDIYKKHFATKHTKNPKKGKKIFWVNRLAAKQINRKSNYAARIAGERM